ncbi:hypothetical protein Esti_005987 [Eimeria stiedai]
MGGPPQLPGGPAGAEGGSPPAEAAEGPPLMDDSAAAAGEERGPPAKGPSPPGAPLPLGLTDAFTGLCAAAQVSPSELQHIADAICEAGGPQVSPSERLALYNCFGAACRLLGGPPPRVDEGGLLVLLRQAAAEGACTISEGPPAPMLRLGEKGPLHACSSSSSSQDSSSKNNDSTNESNHSSISSSSSNSNSNSNSSRSRKVEVEREDISALHKACRCLHHLAWRRLHTGHWEAVPLWCREAFAAACLLLSFCYAAGAACSLAAAEAAADTAAADTAAADTAAADTAAAAAVDEDLFATAEEDTRLAFRYVDLGLIMGGPKLRVYERLTAAAVAFDSLRARLLLLQKQQHQHQQQQHQQQQQQQGQDSPVSRSSSDADCTESNGPPPDESPSRGSPEVPPGPLVRISRRREDVEERTSIGFEDFLVNYLHQQRPVLIRGGASELPCVKLWANWGHLKAKVGHRLVPIEVGSSYSEEGWTQRLMFFEDFLSEFVDPKCWISCCFSDAAPEGPVGYLAQHALFEQLPFLAKEAPPPDLAVAYAEGELTRLVWIGPKRTVSPLHTDSSQNLFVQVVGTKRVQLYPPTQTKALYPFQNGLLLNTSSLPKSLVEARWLPAEVYRQQQQAFPLFFEETHCLDAVLNAGDILFIPRGWWHFVKAETPSVSVSNWFHI